MAVRGRTPCTLSCLEPYMRGFPVWRVPIVARRPTSGEAANPQVRSIYLFPAWVF
jgi:hypothetical protein